MIRWTSFAVLLLITGAAAGVAPPRPPDKADSPRLQKLRQLAFDRRPSAIRPAWAPPAPKKDDKPRPDPLQEELDAFQRRVTLGDWPAVRAYLAGLTKAEARAAYEHLLRSLGRPPAPAAPSP